MTFVAVRVDLADDDRAHLEAWSRSPDSSPELVMRARIVLASAAGEGARALASRLGVSPTTVCLWRRRYREEGLAGLSTRPRPGRPRKLTPDQEQAIVRSTRREGKTARQLAADHGVSPIAVYRVWKRNGLSRRRPKNTRSPSRAPRPSRQGGGLPTQKDRP